jgi:hypothetical protein
MAGAPPSRTPVLNLGRGNEQPDDEPSFARFLQLPPELTVMIYEYHIDSLGTIPSVHSQPPLTRTSRLVRQEALPLFYARSTFGATLDIWTHPNDQGLITHLDQSTEDMLRNIDDDNFPLITKVKLLLNFNIRPIRRFEITFDFTQWDDFARAVRIERVMPRAEMKYENMFMFKVERAMRRMFKDVRPRDGKRINDCEKVLSVAELEVDDAFAWKDDWLDVAYLETIDAIKTYLASK